MSRETSRMISSTFWVEWIRLVTACSFLEKASFTAMSGTLPDAGILVSSTALMVSPVFRNLAHPRPPASGRLAHLLHGERALPGLQVRDENLRPRPHLLQLLGKQPRAQVLGGHRDRALLVGEGGLDDEVLQVVRGVHDLPQGIVGGGVAAE